MTHVLLIDGNNLGYASMYIPELMRLRHNDLETGGIMGVVQSVMRIANLYPKAIPVVLWDGYAHWRKEICPEYKENRKDDPEKIRISESWKNQQPWANTLFLLMGITQIRSANAEADDLAGQICQKMDDHENIERITMVSADKDWWQAIRPKIDWFNPIYNYSVDFEAMKTDKVKDGPFESPAEYLLAKCISGDSSDNIQGVERVGVKTALKLLRKYGGLKGISESVKSGQAKEKTAIAIHDSMDLIARNQSIMDWLLSPSIEEDYFGITRESSDLEGALAICEQLGLNRLAKRLSPDEEWDIFIKKQSGVDLSNTIDLCDFSLCF